MYLNTVFLLLLTQCFKIEIELFLRYLVHNLKKKRIPQCITRITAEAKHKIIKT